MSWDEAFAVGYEEWSAHMTEDVAFYVGLAREADGPVVELAVGTGRVAIPVARAVGQRVIGLEVASLELEALYGGFASELFTDSSTEYVFVARRPLIR